MLGAQGPGPRLCKQCMADRGESTRCEECEEPDLLPENVDAADLYLTLVHQWRRGPTGMIEGLDYSAVESVIRIRGYPDQGELFDRLQVLEFETINISQERHGNQN